MFFLIISCAGQTRCSWTSRISRTTRSKGKNSHDRKKRIMISVNIHRICGFFFPQGSDGFPGVLGAPGEKGKKVSGGFKPTTCCFRKDDFMTSVCLSVLLPVLRVRRDREAALDKGVQMWVPWYREEMKFNLRVRADDTRGAGLNVAPGSPLFSQR